MTTSLDVSLDGKVSVFVRQEGQREVKVMLRLTSTSHNLYMSYSLCLVLPFTGHVRYTSDSK